MIGPTDLLHSSPAPHLKLSRCFWFWVQQVKHHFTRRNRRENQSNTRLVNTQKTIRIIRSQYDRCSGLNENRLTWRSEFVSVIWRGALTSYETSSSSIISEGIKSSSACMTRDDNNLVEQVQSWRVRSRPVKANSHMPSRTYAAPMSFADSAVSFVKVRVVAGNIRTASPTV
jgi:hypothetical protein